MSAMLKVIATDLVKILKKLIFKNILVEFKEK